KLALVRQVALLYFLVFIAIFSIDYLFWKQCHVWFATGRALASFQFTFYLAHAACTIICLLLVMPRVIATFGFLRAFYFLPVTLLLSALLLLAGHFLPVDKRILFGIFIALQFVRYVVFENAFSPVYQIFFAAIESEKRGRAKMVMEGLVKPTAIIMAGVAVIVFDRYLFGLLPFIAVCAAGMIVAVFRIRATYMRGLIPPAFHQALSFEIIEEIGTTNNQKILSLIGEYSHAPEADLRRFAVKMLVQVNTREAFKFLYDLYEREQDRRVRETIAASLAPFSGVETRPFIERLLNDPNPRIRANALFSLNGIASPWKWRFKEPIRAMLFENNTRVQIEAAQYLAAAGDPGDQEKIAALVKYLLSVDDANLQSAGLFLVGQVRPPSWESLMLAHLQSSSMQVFTKCIEVIFRSASLATALEALGVIEGLSRHHISQTGTTLAAMGLQGFAIVVRGIRRVTQQRMMFELIHALRKIVDSLRAQQQKFTIEPETETVIVAWFLRQLEQIYRDCYIWAYSRHELNSLREVTPCILEEAVRENVLRACQWAIDILMLLDREGVMVWERKDFDLHETGARQAVVEIIESAGSSQVGAMVVPLLRFDSWDSIARKGRNLFRFSSAEAASDISYFLGSTNRWICLTALYCIYKRYGSFWFREHAGELARISGGRFSKSGKAVTVFINSIAQHGEPDMETLALLEAVMFFKKTPLFRNVAAERLMGVAEISQVRAFAKDTVISNQDEIADHLYIVARGSLRIVKFTKGYGAVLGIVREGEAYGEIGLFTASPRSASAIAEEDCELYIIRRSAFKKVLLEIPEISYNFLEIFSEKLRKSGEEVALLQTTLTHGFTDRTQLHSPSTTH
ncbi:MAG: HEAT repeat domain-containing protein, partial [Chitinivibrionales bacterium]|nr:HEAT repeat domain-containing protein [Chitinivibrionales bacterium]